MRPTGTSLSGPWTCSAMAATPLLTEAAMLAKGFAAMLSLGVSVAAASMAWLAFANGLLAVSTISFWGRDQTRTCARSSTLSRSATIFP